MKNNVDIDALDDEVVKPLKRIIHRHDELRLDSHFVTYGGNHRFAYIEVGSESLNNYQAGRISQFLDNVCSKLRYKKCACEGVHVALKEYLQYETFAKNKLNGQE